MEKIKPCPFCGVQGELFVDRHFEKWIYWLECSNEYCSANVDYNSEEEAIEAWNIRKEEG